MYQALYRKYRPKDFDSLVGQDHITNVLKNQVDTGHISHAYLFSGTRGTGKTSAAKIFARAVNCTGENKPCNNCDNCIESIEESSVDIIEIDAASNSGVDNIRDIRDRAFYQPTSLKYKVYIIDEVHMLSKGAFNALLKILEEPPEHVIFILATTEPERIPLTILSRVQKFQFNRIGPDVIVKRMEYICETEGKNVEPEVLNLVVSKSDGSMRDALSILDQLFATGADTIDYSMAIDTLGIVGADTLFDLVDSILARDGRWIDLLDDTLSSGKDISQLSTDILEHFRRLMIAKISPNSLARYVYSDNDKYISQSSELDIDFITDSMKILVDNISESRYSNQKRALLDIAILEIVSRHIGVPKVTKAPVYNTELEIPYNSPQPEYLQSNTENRESMEPNPIIDGPNQDIKTDNIVEQTKEDAETEEAPEPTADDIEPADDADLQLERIQNDWKQILNYLEKEGPAPMVAIIKQGSPIKLSEDLLTIGFHNDNRGLMENGKRYVPTIEKSLNMLYNKTDIKVQLDIMTETSSNDNNAQDDMEKFLDLMGDHVTIED